MLETLLQELQKLERPIAPQAREALMSKISAHQQTLDPRYKADSWMGKRSIFFHSLQDLTNAALRYGEWRQELPQEFYSEDQFLELQACFAQNLQDYLRLLPPGEDPDGRIRGVFESILKVGTSANWAEDQELVVKLYPLYQAVDSEVIRPWANEVPIPRI